MILKNNEQYIADVLSSTIAEALMVSLEKVIPSARLISDLAVESIDIVDIRFRIEQALGIKINQDAMTESLGKNLSADEFDNLFTVKFIIDYVTGIINQNE